MKTTSYFDDRPDSRFYAANIDGVVVSIRENLPTCGVTDGEVWAACWIQGQLLERRFQTTRGAQLGIPRLVRSFLGQPDVPSIGAWVALARKEYAVACPVCRASFGQPCIDGDRAQALATRQVSVLVSGAPWCPEVHELDVTLPPLIHMGRRSQHYRSLHGHAPARRVASEG